MHEPPPGNDPALPDEVPTLTDWFLGEARQLAQEPSGDVKREHIRKLVEDARLERLDINSELIKAAGETPESILPAELDALINLLATLRRALGEPPGARDGRVESALLAADADNLGAFVDHCGRPCLQHPRRAVEWLLASPRTCDLVLPDFATLQSKVLVAELPPLPLPSDAEAPPAQPTKGVPEPELMRWIKIVASGRTLPEIRKLAKTGFPGRHVSNERIRLAVQNIDPRPRGHPLGKGKTRPRLPRPKS
jgi:hypothetical protein